LDAMMKKGQVTGVKRVELTTLEGQVCSLTLGENRPYVTGMVVTATGNTSKQLTYRNVGTQVKVTSQVSADRSVILDMNVQDSRSRFRHGDGGDRREGNSHPRSRVHPDVARRQDQGCVGQGGARQGRQGHLEGRPRGDTHRRRSPHH